jgi:VWFA-related protein
MRVALLAILSCSLAAGQESRPAPPKLFVDCSEAELLRALPELASTKFESGQDGLEPLLKTAGAGLDAMLSHFADVVATEQIHEMRLASDMGEASRREGFRYVIRGLANRAAEGFTEFRLDSTNQAAATPPDLEFLVIDQFYKAVRYLLPDYRKESRFRFLGRVTVDGQDLFVVAFAERPESTLSLSDIAASEDHAPLQGIAWFDAESRLVRLRTDLIGPSAGLPLAGLTTDMALVPVNFPSLGATLWLPASVTVDGVLGAGEFHTVHHYSGYRPYGDDGQPAGIGSLAAPDDAWELLDRGITLLHGDKAADAVAPLRGAVRINPRLAAARYQLAAALRATNDSVGAEAELREAIKLAPDSGHVHNFLALLLFNRGDLTEALTELRISARLEPEDAAVHANLATVLEKTGDRTGALEEFHTASELSPDNATFKARYAELARAPNPPPATAPGTVSVPAGSTIKVEVRQVLVPVVVRDKQGHSVTGLTRADFQVFEDGVEQKITGFGVEDVAVPGPSPAVPAAASSTQTPGGGVPPPAPKALPVRRTYVICIDALHTAFASLVYIRKALGQLFEKEKAGDAQYAVVAIGIPTQVLVNTTSDPAAVLKAIDNSNFQKTYLGSRKSSSEADIRDFEGALNRARNACDSHDPSCPVLVQALPPRARGITAQDEVYTKAFLHDFRTLIEDLRHGAGRRTVILFSDGFELVPGKLAWDLLSAYFSSTPGSSLQATERMPDLEPVLQLAANSNIPVYTIDSRGLYTSPFFDAQHATVNPRVASAVMSAMDYNAREAGETLSEIAAATGGTAFRNNNDLFAGLDRAFADGREYYMLAYNPSNFNLDGKFRTISVKLKDKNLQVSAKRGYWASE